MHNVGCLLSVTLALSAAFSQQAPTTLPDLPNAYTAQYVSGATTTKQYVDSSAKKFATYATGTAGTIFAVRDCGAKLTYSNAPALPIPGLPAGPCTLKPPSPYYDTSGCPSIYAPTWPTTPVDFYAGYKKLMTYSGTKACTTSGGVCWRYYHAVGDKIKNTFEFLVRSDNQLPDSGSITYSGVTYVHTFVNASVDPSKLGRQDGCPDPSGACAICFTGQCGPCQQCKGQPKTGACSKCWAPDAASGFSCMSETAGKDLCTKCWAPTAPTPPPAPPTPPPVPNTCGGSCSPLGISGQCCPTATGANLPCCTAPTPGPAPSPGGACPGGSLAACIGLCPASPTSVYQACVQSCSTRCNSGPPPPTPPAPPPPTPPTPTCDICNGDGQCAKCTACEASKDGPCAPCWADHSGFSCLPFCQDKCWSSMSNSTSKSDYLNLIRG